MATICVRGSIALFISLVYIILFGTSYSKTVYNISQYPRFNSRSPNPWRNQGLFSGLNTSQLNDSFQLFGDDPFTLHGDFDQSLMKHLSKLAGNASHKYFDAFDLDCLTGLRNDCRNPLELASDLANITFHDLIRLLETETPRPNSRSIRSSGTASNFRPFVAVRPSMFHPEESQYWNSRNMFKYHPYAASPYPVKIHAHANVPPAFSRSINIAEKNLYDERGVHSSGFESKLPSYFNIPSTNYLLPPLSSNIPMPQIPPARHSSRLTPESDIDGIKAAFINERKINYHPFSQWHVPENLPLNINHMKPVNHNLQMSTPGNEREGKLPEKFTDSMKTSENMSSANTQNQELEAAPEVVLSNLPKCVSKINKQPSTKESHKVPSSETYESENVRPNLFVNIPSRENLKNTSKPNHSKITTAIPNLGINVTSNIHKFGRKKLNTIGNITKQDSGIDVDNFEEDHLTKRAQKPIYVFTEYMNFTKIDSIPQKDKLPDSEDASIKEYFENKPDTITNANIPQEIEPEYILNGVHNFTEGDNISLTPAYYIQSP